MLRHIGDPLECPMDRDGTRCGSIHSYGVWLRKQKPAYRLEHPVVRQYDYTMHLWFGGHCYHPECVNNIFRREYDELARIQAEFNRRTRFGAKFAA